MSEPKVFEMDMLQALKDLEDRFVVVATQANETIRIADEHINEMRVSLRKLNDALGMSEMAALEKAINDAIELRLKALKSHEAIMSQINKLITSKLKADAISSSRRFFPPRPGYQALPGNIGEIDLSELD